MGDHIELTSRADGFSFGAYRAPNDDARRGGLVLITDHINLQGCNPLVGPNDDSLGPRFPDMSDAYARQYRDIAKAVAAQLCIPIGEGVYAALLGPSYETPAEIRYLRAIGADLVGMSTALEVIAANHMGMKVLGISCVTNMAAGILAQKINHEEVLETGAMVRAVRERGPDHGFYGARVSGGGSGGTVVVLLEAAALPELERLAADPSLDGVRPAPLIV